MRAQGFRAPSPTGRFRDYHCLEEACDAVTHVTPCYENTERYPAVSCDPAMINKFYFIILFKFVI